jgi:AraC-like DNA-binding protein
MQVLLQLPATQRGGLRLERSILGAPEGGVALRQRMTGSAERVIVTHAAGLLADVRVLSGRVELATAADSCIAPERFVLLVPQRSVLRVRYSDALVESDGLGLFEPLEGPACLRRARTDVPLTRAALLATELEVALPVDRGVNPRLRGARAFLHDQLHRLAPVDGAARAAGMDPDVFARGFRRAYGLPPKQYCTRARMFDAVLQLCRGAGIAEAAFAAGWNDLSRFYAQFRRVVGATPGAYTRVGKRQDASGSRR